MTAPLLQRLRNMALFLFPPQRSWGYMRLAAQSGHFDRAYYRAANPQLNALYRMFPVRHYVLFGESLGLQPSPEFSPGIYLHYAPDLVEAERPPLLHYIQHGHTEGRLTRELPPSISAVLDRAPALHAEAPQDNSAEGMPDLTRVAAEYAVHVHIYYHDLWDDFSARLAEVNIGFDLFVTITDVGEPTDNLVTQIAEEFPRARVIRMPNHGRDIFPFVHLINSGLLDGYKAVCKIHTKKSPHRSDGDVWRDHLVASVLPGPDTKRLVECFMADHSAAFLVAQDQYYSGIEWWGINQPKTAAILSKVEEQMDPDVLAFPAGSIYWVKPHILGMIKGMSLRQRDFEPEAGQVDGTLAHAVERAMGYLATAAGQTVREMPDLDGPPRIQARLRPRFTSAFYLPQFHPTPENDQWWGKGFTEWQATTRARPQFDNHKQPQLPGALGFYDLRLPEAMGQQWQLARRAGIDAFCVYHYWFGGRRVLQQPMENLLGRPDIPFRFYLCWANESWRRNWDGLSGEELITQDYADGFEEALAKDIAPYMQDPRYQRPDGSRPRFVIYRPEDMPDPEGSVARLRAAWRKLGVGEVELGAVLFHIGGQSPVDAELFDFWVEMPPHGLVGNHDYIYGGPEGNKPGFFDPHPGFEGLIYDYTSLLQNSTDPGYVKQLPSHTIAGIMPSWDNTARRGPAAHIAYGANPVRFGRWLDGLLAQRLAGSYGQELFINAWNEWAEKTMLEPCEQYGSTNLELLRSRIRRNV